MAIPLSLILPLPPADDIASASAPASAPTPAATADAPENIFYTVYPI